MFFGKPRASGYSGRASYRYVDDMIRGPGRELKVITPFLGGHYARMLVSASSRKRIRVIVSSGDSETLGSVSLLERAGSGADYRVLIVLPVLAAASFMAGMAVTASVLLFALLAYLAFHGFRAAGMRRNLQVRRARSHFVHEKVFLSERRAIVGSANLTYRGTHSNVEHIEVIEDRGRILELSTHFDELWRSAGME